MTTATLPLTEKSDVKSWSSAMAYATKRGFRDDVRLVQILVVDVTTTIARVDDVSFESAC